MEIEDSTLNEESDLDLLGDDNESKGEPMLKELHAEKEENETEVTEDQENEESVDSKTPLDLSVDQTEKSGETEDEEEVEEEGEKEDSQLKKSYMKLTTGFYDAVDIFLQDLFDLFIPKKKEEEEEGEFEDEGSFEFLKTNRYSVFQFLVRSCCSMIILSIIIYLPNVILPCVLPWSIICVTCGICTICCINLPLSVVLCLCNTSLTISTTLFSCVYVLIAPLWGCFSSCIICPILSIMWEHFLLIGRHFIWCYLPCEEMGYNYFNETAENLIDESNETNENEEEENEGKNNATKKKFKIFWSEIKKSIRSLVNIFLLTIWFFISNEFQIIFEVIVILIISTPPKLELYHLYEDYSGSDINAACWKLGEEINPSKNPLVNLCVKSRPYEFHRWYFIGSLPFIFLYLLIFLSIEVLIISFFFRGFSYHRLKYLIVMETYKQSCFRRTLHFIFRFCFLFLYVIVMIVGLLVVYIESYVVTLGGSSNEHVWILMKNIFDNFMIPYSIIIVYLWFQAFQILSYRGDSSVDYIKLFQFPRYNELPDIGGGYLNLLFCTPEKVIREVQFLISILTKIKIKQSFNDDDNNKEEEGNYVKDSEQPTDSLKEKLKVFSKSKQFGHMNWGLISGMSNEQLQNLQSFFVTDYRGFHENSMLDKLCLSPCLCSISCLCFCCCCVVPNCLRTYNFYRSPYRDFRSFYTSKENRKKHKFLKGDMCLTNRPLKILKKFEIYYDEIGKEKIREREKQIILKEKKGLKSLFIRRNNTSQVHPIQNSSEENNDGEENEVDEEDKQQQEEKLKKIMKIVFKHLVCCPKNFICTEWTYTKSIIWFFVLIFRQFYVFLGIVFFGGIMNHSMITGIFDGGDFDVCGPGVNYSGANTHGDVESLRVNYCSDTSKDIFTSIVVFQWLCFSTIIIFIFFSDLLMKLIVLIYFMFNKIKFMIGYGIVKEWIGYRIVMSSILFFLWVICLVVLVLRHVSFFNFTSFLDYFFFMFQMIFILVFICVKSTNFWYYDGASSFSYLSSLCCKSYCTFGFCCYGPVICHDFVLPDINASLFSCFFEEPDAVIQKIIVCLANIENRNDLLLKRKNSKFAHLGWNYLKNLNDYEIGKLQRFFFSFSENGLYDEEESVFSKCCCTTPKKLKFWKACIWFSLTCFGECCFTKWCEWLRMIGYFVFCNNYALELYDDIVDETSPQMKEFVDYSAMETKKFTAKVRERNDEKKKEKEILENEGEEEEISDNEIEVVGEDDKSK